MTYVIRFWNKGQTEEYDGGKTLTEARKEAKFFREHVAADIEIKICKIVDGERLSLMETI